MLNWDDPLAEADTAEQDAIANIPSDVNITAETPAVNETIPASTLVTTALDADAGATGLESIEMGAARIRVDDKKIINCRADLNQ